MYDVDMGAAAVAAAQELNLPSDLIEEIRQMLGRNADDLEHHNVQPIAESVFGGSERGGELGYHSSVAQQHVARAVLQMAAGLRGYRENLGRFSDDLGDTDVERATVMQGLQESTVCVAAPTFETNNACTLPVSSSTGGE